MVYAVWYNPRSGGKPAALPVYLSATTADNPQPSPWYLQSPVTMVRPEGQIIIVEGTKSRGERLENDVLHRDALDMFS